MTSELMRAYELVLEDLEHRIENAFERALRRVMNSDEPAPKPPEEPATPPEVAPTTTGWVEIPEAKAKRGRVTRTFKPQQKVRVQKLGRGGTIGSGWYIVKLMQRGDVINVDVNQGRGTIIRTVRLDDVIYVIPKQSA